MDDEDKAKLLSQKAGAKMKSVFVRTRAQLNDVRKAQASAFCEEVNGFVKGRVGGAKRGGDVPRML